MPHKFVALPKKSNDKVLLYSWDFEEDKEIGVRQVLWGDWLSVKTSHSHSKFDNTWLEVDWAPKSDNPQTLYIKKEHTTNTRPLEIIFLDVGQGDGAVLISPERDENEKIIVVDAGEGEHMHNFLDKRFKAYRGFNFHAAIITHPDKDHYYGFRDIFEDENVGFDIVYHNGLVERPVSSDWAKLGGLKKDPNNEVEYLEDLATTSNDIKDIFSDKRKNGRKLFPKVMYNALQNPNIKVFKMLSTDPNHTVQVDNRNYMPEFDPKPGRDYSIEVLGPFVEKTGNKPRLRRLGDYGKTKNGHSIILRLHYGKYKVLFGGDLNKNAEEFLLKQYANRTEFPEKGTPDSKAMIFEASKYFGADVMKVCHHGASDVTDEFMETVNPAAFVISSGDEEGHVHPRPDLLGRLGRFGKGESPVLLSTELQRSSREKEDQDNIKSLKKTIKAMVSNCSDESQLKELQKELDKQIGVLSKTNVDVYGSIYLKTDGERLITAFKYEEPSKTKKWFYFEYEIDNEGVLQIRK